MADKHLRPVVEEVSPTQPEPTESVSNSSIPAAQDNPEPPHDLEDQAKQTLESLNNPPTPKPNKKHTVNLKLIILITLITAVVVGVVAGGVYVFLSRPNSKDTMMQNTDSTLQSPEPSQTPEPTTTPEPVDLSAYKLNILNGSGKIGEASKVGNLLEEDGFVVDTTGNANRYDYKKTIIQIKPDVPDDVSNSISSLLKNAGYAPESGDNLTPDDKFDITITVGQSN